MLYQVELGKLVKHEVTQEAELLPTLVLVTTMIMLSLPLPRIYSFEMAGKPVPDCPKARFFRNLLKGDSIRLP